MKTIILIWVSLFAAIGLGVAQPVDDAAIEAKATVVRVLDDGIIAKIQFWDYETDSNGIRSETKHLRRTVDGFVQLNPGPLVDGDMWSGRIWRVGSYKDGSQTLAKFTSDPKSALAGDEKKAP